MKRRLMVPLAPVPLAPAQCERTEAQWDKKTSAENEGVGDPVGN